MPQQYTTQDQVRYLSEWFNTWSELQRDDFLPVLAQALAPAANLNGLIGGVTSMNVTGRPPSLFDCQVRKCGSYFNH